jgi:hypothetical protein
MNSRRFTAAPKLRTSHRNGYPTSFKQGNVPSARGLAYARIDKNNLAGRTIGSSEGVSWRQRQSWYLISCCDRRQWRRVSIPVPSSLQDGENPRGDGNTTAARRVQKRANTDT